MPDIKSAIADVLAEHEELWHPCGFLEQRCGGSFDDAAQVVFDELSDRLGTVQEKLLNDLQAARSELDAERRRSAALAETVKTLSAVE